MVTAIAWAIGVIFILTGLLYYNKPSWAAAFWRQFNIISRRKWYTSVVGVLILCIGVVFLIYGFFF